MSLLRHLGGCPVLLTLATSAALAAPDDAAQRQSLAQQRATADATFAQAHAACSSAFAVTACVDDARQRRRVALQAIQVEQNKLDDQQRLARRNERLAIVAQRRAEQAASAASAASSPVAPRDGAAVAAHSGASRPVRAAAPSVPIAKPAAMPEHARTAGAARAPDADSALRYRQRQQRAAEHAEAVRLRNAKLDAKNEAKALAKGQTAASAAAAAGLPVPALAASAAAPQPR